MSTLAQAIRMESPETIPVSAGALPAAWIKYGSEMRTSTPSFSAG